MIDDTPEVRWSNAWWTQVLLGLCVPPVLLGLALYGLLTGHSYALVGDRFTIGFVPIQGAQATLMSVAYIGFALAAFAHGYCRFSDRLHKMHLPLLVLGLLGAAAFTIWSTLLFFTG